MPSSADPKISLGDLFQSVGRFEEAAESYRDAIRTEPTHPVAAARFSRSARAVGRSGARSRISSISRPPPPLGAALDDARDRPLRSGDPVGAREAAEKALAIDPEREEALLLAGERTSRPAAAFRSESYFRRAIATDPRSIRGLFGLGRVFLATNRPLDADAEFAKVLEIDPSYSAVHTARGRWLEAPRRNRRRGRGVPARPGGEPGGPAGVGGLEAARPGTLSGGPAGGFSSRVLPPKKRAGPESRPLSEAFASDRIANLRTSSLRRRDCRSAG